MIAVERAATSAALWFDPGMPRGHVGCLCRAIGAGSEEAIVEVGVDVVSLDDPHQVQGVGTAREAAICIENVVAYRLGARDAVLADFDSCGVMLWFQHQVRAGVGPSLRALLS